ncbi:Transcription termination factor MTERF5, chloroplastic-like protein [Drosera capensis]
MGHSFSLRAKVICFRGKLVESGMDGSSSLKPVNRGAGRNESRPDLGESSQLWKSGKLLTLEAFHCQHGDAFSDMVVHFPDPPPEVKPSLQTLPLELDPDQEKLPCLAIDSIRPRAMGRVSETVPVEDLPPHVIYLVELGLDLQKIRVIISLEGKVKPLVEFLLELGVPKSGIPNILYRRPHLCGFSLSNKLIPTIKYLEGLGVDKQKWSKGWPQILTLSIESNLRPMTEFFLEKGYSMEEIAMMIQRAPSLYTFSLSKNVLPEWEFFLSMGYPRSELVKFSPYFGYSLEVRIKPRYALMELRGVRMPLNQLLSLSDVKLDKALRAKMKKLEKSDS